jgi:hypothetical protein
MYKNVDYFHKIFSFSVSKSDEITVEKWRVFNGKLHDSHCSHCFSSDLIKMKVWLKYLARTKYR